MPEVQLPARPRPAVPGVRVDRDVAIPARDGTILRVDIYRPDVGDGKWPALYAVSPYQKALAGLPVTPAFPFRETGPIEWYVQRGYVYVLADARGTGASDGVWDMLSEDEQTDLFDTVEWIAAQPWCTGRVGMIGQSYYGLIQWLAAIQRPPHLACIAPYDALVDPYRDNQFHGGIPSTGFNAVWALILRGNHQWGPAGPNPPGRFATDSFQLTFDHPADDAYWRARAAYWRLDQIDIPVLSVGNWGKNSLHLRGNLIGYESVSGPRQLRVEAGSENGALNVAKALLDFESVKLHEEVLAPWYDHWLKGEQNGVMDRPPVEVHVSGTDQVRSFSQWPPAEITPVAFILDAGPAGAVDSLNDGTLTTSPGYAGPAGTSYSYPDPEWYIGSATFTSSGVPDPIARILTFTTTELANPMTVVGPVALELYASSDQVDTDFIVRLVDQAPRPEHRPPDLPAPSRVVSRGWLRASHRSLDPVRSTVLRPFHPHDDASPLEPGKIYRFDIELMPLAHVFQPGHRIRLEICCADSAVTEGIFTHFFGVKYGTDTICHSADAPSRLLLPVLPE